MLTKKAQHPKGSGLRNTFLPILVRASLTNGSQHVCRVGAACNAWAYRGYTWVFRPVWTFSGSWQASVQPGIGVLVKTRAPQVSIFTGTGTAGSDRLLMGTCSSVPTQSGGRDQARLRHGTKAQPAVATGDLSGLNPRVPTEGGAFRLQSRQHGGGR